MLYYRYRSASELSYKELLYSEIYFSSTEECNDPFDSKTFYEFTSDKIKWSRFLKLVFRDFEYALKNDAFEKFLNFFLKICPISYDALINLNYEFIFSDLLASEDSPRAYQGAQIFRSFLRIYQPAISYFVSFSKSNNDPLMWSHYASNHEGYCLIFRSISNQLMQCPFRYKKQIRRDTPNGLGASASNSLPEGFRFNDVDYVSDSSPLSAFICLPASITEEKLSDEERVKLKLKQESQYLQKHISWKYENESRLIIQSPKGYIFGDRFEYTVQERLFNYEPNQLVGIIFGSRMNRNSKNRIREILRDRKDRLSRASQENRVIFDFVVFEANISNKRRDLNIIPISMISFADEITPQNPDFDRRLREWDNGVGYRTIGSTSKTVKV